MRLLTVGVSPLAQYRIFRRLNELLCPSATGHGKARSIINVFDSLMQLSSGLEVWLN